MKYSIIGSLHKDEGVIIDLINNYTLWKLVPENTEHPITGEDMIGFEVWLSFNGDALELYNTLKQYVIKEGDYVSWHRCYHDENLSIPCKVEEEYRM